MCSFKERNQRILMRSGTDLSTWPPTPIDSDKEGSFMLNHSIFRVVVGNTECSFVFQAYQNAASSAKEKEDETSSVVGMTASTSAEGKEMVPMTEMEGTPLLSGPTRLYS